MALLTEVQHVNLGVNIQGVAVDYINQLVAFVSYIPANIYIRSYDNDGNTTLLNTTAGVAPMTDVKIDPVNRLLFVLEDNFPAPYLIRSYKYDLSGNATSVDTISSAVDPYLFMDVDAENQILFSSTVGSLYTNTYDAAGNFTPADSLFIAGTWGGMSLDTTERIFYRCGITAVAPARAGLESYKYSSVGVFTPIVDYENLVIVGVNDTAASPTNKVSFFTNGATLYSYTYLASGVFTPADNIADPLAQTMNTLYATNASQILICAKLANGLSVYSFNGSGQLTFDSFETTYDAQRVGYDEILGLAFVANLADGITSYSFVVPDPPPTPGLYITATPESGDSPLNVQFIAVLIGAFPGNIVSYEWQFGDEISRTRGVQGSNSEAPSHIYEMAGTYEAICIVTFGDGSTLTSTITIRVYDYQYGSDSGARDPIASLTDKCYRLPVRPGDGYGPSEYADSENVGSDWVWPPSEKGTATAINRKKEEIALAIDAKTQVIYRLNDITAWRDRIGGYSPGNRIDSWIHQRSDEARKGEQVALVHTESHLHMEAFEKDLKGAAGYDSEGFPTGLRVDMHLHEDNKEVAAKKTIRVPKNGDIVYREKAEAGKLQTRIKVYDAPWLIVEVQHEYESIDKAARPSLRQMTESTFQENLSSLPLFHVTRNFFPLRNRATGENATGTIASLITGPDGRDFSALNFAAGNGLSDTLPAQLSGDFTLSVWCKDMLTLPLTLYTIGTLTVSIEVGYVLRFNDGVNPVHDTPLTFNGVSWTNITITRESLEIKAYENKVFLGMANLNTIENYGTAFRNLNVAEGSLFDSVLLPRAITLEEIEYYYDNILTGGSEVLPDF